MKTDYDWRILGARLKEIKTRPPLKIRDVARVLDYKSTSTALYALNKFIEIGLVVTEQRGERKEYYLNENL